MTIERLLGIFGGMAFTLAMQDLHSVALSGAPNGTGSTLLFSNVVRQFAFRVYLGPQNRYQIDQQTVFTGIGHALLRA